MRLNPFTRPKQAHQQGRHSHYNNDGDANEEDMAVVSRVKQQQPKKSSSNTTSSSKRRSSSPGRPSSKKEGREAPPVSDDENEDPVANLSYAGGSSYARDQFATRHGRSSVSKKSTHKKNRRASKSSRMAMLDSESEPERDDIEDPVSEDDDDDSSPEESRYQMTKQQKQRSAPPRDASSSPERDPVARRRHGKDNASKASSRRLASNQERRRSMSMSSYGSDDDSGNDDDDDEQSGVPPPPRRRRRPSASGGSATSNNKQGSKNSRRKQQQPSRRSRSRGRSPSMSASERSASRSRGDNDVVIRPARRQSRVSSDEEDMDRSYHSRRSRSTTAKRDKNTTRSSTKKSNSSSKSKTVVDTTSSHKKHSWGLAGMMKMPKSPFHKKQEHHQHEEQQDHRHENERNFDADVFSEEDESCVHDHYEQRQAPAPPRRQKKAVPVKAADEHYVAKKRETFANLYEYDNFPAIDRVPTAIGYHSDDSAQDLDQIAGGGRSRRSSRRRSTKGGNIRPSEDQDYYDNDDDEEDDDERSCKSFTSRYSIDVKSVRSSKLKKKKNSSRGFQQNKDDDDDFSHDENDDKYAQYMAGMQINAVLSDSSESCPPTWHPALDAEDSDWYDDEDDDDEEAMKKRGKRGGANTNKKYQVSGTQKSPSNKKKSQKKAKVAVEAKKKRSATNKEEEEKGKKEKASVGLDAETEAPEQEEEVPDADAVVANRSDLSELMPKSSRARVPGALLDNEEELNVATFDSDEMTGVVTENKRHQKKHHGGRKKGGKSRQYDEEDEDEEEDDSSVEYNDDNRRGNRKNARSGKVPARKNISGTKKRPSVKAVKGMTKSKSKGLAQKFKSFGLKGRRTEVPAYASESDESSEGSIGIAATQTFYSEAPSRAADPLAMQLEEEEYKESTATHNMLRQNRKELFELDEMDDNSRMDMNPGCSVFNFGLPSFNFFGNTQPTPDEAPLDGVQIQRLKDAKNDLENKPKVEVILQDLQDPLAEKYEQLEKMQRKQKKELQQVKEAQHEIERREHQELLRMKQRMREMEQKKIQMAQAKDSRSLQVEQAPELTRGKSQSFVMDISDWVLQLDNPSTPGRKSVTRDKDTPRTNGRDGSSPLEKLPFNMIEVPTTTTADSGDELSRNLSRSSKSRSSKKSSSSKRSSKSGSQKKGEKKKKGWFRRG